ncbi:MAG: hypothetical protein ACXWDK_08645 [Aeromicrobium sp.]
MFAPIIAVSALSVVMLAEHGVPALDSGSYAAYLFFVVLLPGRLVWRRIMAASAFERDWPEEEVPGRGLVEWVCGASVGYVLELLVYPLARLSGHPRLYVLLPAVIILALGYVEWRRPRRRRAGSRAVGWGFAAVVGYFVVWLSVTVFARYRLSPYRILDEDETFHLALVGELRHHFPPAYPYVEAGPLTYQWFVHAHMAASTWVTGLDPVTTYRRFDVLVLGALCVLGTAAVTIRVTQRYWPGLVASGVLVLVGSFDVSGIVPGQSPAEDRFMESGLLLNSPTQTMGFALAMPVILLSLECLRPRDGARDWQRWVALTVGMAALAGTKVTFVPIFVCGFLAACGIAAWQHRPEWRPAVVAALLGISVIIISGRVLYSGDTQTLVWNPGATTRWYMRQLGVGGGGVVGTGVVTAAIALGWLLSGVGAVGLLRLKHLRWDPRVWWLLGCIAAGVGATFLLGHGGMSQLYFGRSAGPLLAIASGWGVSALFPIGTRSRHALSAIVASLIGGALLLGARFVTEGLRDAAVVKGEVVTTPLLRVWVNVPVLLSIITALLLAHLLVRDLSGGKVRLDRRLIVAFLLGLGLARSLAFLGGHFPDVDPAKAEKGLGGGGVVAARWLRDHSSPNDRVITNAHCLHAQSPSNPECDSRHFWMSGLTERRFVVEGWAYTRFSEGWGIPFWGDAEFLEANDAVFSQPSRKSLSEFLDDHPAEWLMVDLRLPVDEAALAHIPGVDMRFQRGSFQVYALTESTRNP